MYHKSEVNLLTFAASLILVGFAVSPLVDAAITGRTLASLIFVYLIDDINRFSSENLSKIAKCEKKILELEKNLSKIEKDL